MAEAFAKQLLPSDCTIISAGTQPASEINPLAVKVMEEIGYDMSNQHPKKLTTAMLSGTTRFISMGCGVLESCPVPIVRGTLAVEDWSLEDPAGKDISFFREIRGQIEHEVTVLATVLEQDR